MKHDIRILFFDVDGTLVGPNKRVLGGSTLEALKRARALGIKLVVSTGRNPRELHNLSNFVFDAYATMNGQVCYDASGAMLRLNPAPKADIARLIGILEREPFACCFIELTRSYLNMITERARRLYEQVNVPIPEVGDIRQALSNDVYQLNFFTTPEHEAEVLERLPGLMARRWGMLHADVIARSNGKRDGVEAVLKHFGLTRAQAMSFGDGENDLEMFEATGLSVAMGNAPDVVKAGACMTTARYDDDGIMRALTAVGVLAPA